MFCGGLGIDDRRAPDASHDEFRLFDWKLVILPVRQVFDQVAPDLTFQTPAPVFGGICQSGLHPAEVCLGSRLIQVGVNDELSRFKLMDFVTRCRSIIGKTLARNVQSQRKTEQGNDVESGF